MEDSASTVVTGGMPSGRNRDREALDIDTHVYGVATVRPGARETASAATDGNHCPESSIVPELGGSDCVAAS
jgi:hypothetical protein